MAPESAALLGGLLFLLIAIVGGGFTIKEIIMPAVPGWARVASLVLGAVLLVPYFADALRSDDSGSAVPQAASVSTSSPAPDGVLHDERDRRDVSPEGIELSGLIATSASSRPVVGDRIDVEFSLRNAGADPVTLEETFVAARSPDDEHRDFGHGNAGVVFGPGQTLTIDSSLVVDSPGLWTISPCYAIATGGDPTFCPSEWRRFQVLVGG